VKGLGPILVLFKPVIEIPDATFDPQKNISFVRLSKDTLIATTNSVG